MIAAFCLLGVSSCQTERLPANRDFRAYFPLEVGSWAEYRIDSIRFSNDGTGNIQRDTVVYYVREEIESEFTAINGSLLFRIERYQRNDTSTDWQIDRVWSAQLDEEYAVKTEDEFAFRKMRFPVNRQVNWSGNALIDSDRLPDYMQDWQYRYAQLHEFWQGEYLSTDSSVQVVQHADSNLLEMILSTERYALGKGMVEKRLLVLSSSQFDSAALQMNFIDRADEGFIFHQELMRFSK